MRLALALATLAVIGVTLVGLHITNFTIYLGNDPAACNTCHVMGAAYEGWYHSPHRQVACAECHAPHDLIPKYLFKGWAGAKDVFFFGTGRTPDAIRASGLSKDILQANCIRCHAETVSEIADGQAGAGRYCFDCHRAEPHGLRGNALYQ